jgi:hypothetical protein
LFLDSGTIEYNKYKNIGIHEEWNIDLYMEYLENIEREKAVILVNYDTMDNIEKQISLAEASFKESFISDFLIRSNKENDEIDLVEFADNIDGIKKFDIIGLTEKELGKNYLRRCQNLINLRIILNENNLNKPIHIFGCLDPLSIYLYFLCGADIFDGLTWIKMSYNEQFAIYRNNHSLLNEYFEFSYSESFKIMLIDNLNYLKNFQKLLVDFGVSEDWGLFKLNNGIERKIRLLLSKSGIDILVD